MSKRNSDRLGQIAVILPTSLLLFPILGGSENL